VTGAEQREIEACKQRLQEAECDAKVARVKHAAEYEEALAKLKVQRLRREESERVARLQRLESERVARAEIARKWSEQEALRRAARKRSGRGWLRDYWKRPEGEDGGPSGTLAALLMLGAPALVAVVIYAIAVDGWKVLATALLTAAASFAVGALLGFLFGIPRSTAPEPADGAAATAAKGDGADAPAYRPNTNLEQISDWLTKILVGIGLVQIHQVSGAVNDLADGLEAGLGGGDTGHAVAVALLISFSIAGFVTAYLFTRLRLQGAFEWSGLLRRAVKVQAEKENSALALVHRQLDPGADDPPLNELTDALKGATSGVRTQAFYLARDQRRNNWRDGETELVAPTIPVFRALIACEPKAHRYHAELGYALKDQAKPDYAEAMAALKKAIALRPDGKETRFYLYEYNLAYCEIKLAEQASRSSAKDVVSSVTAILTTVAQTEAGARVVARKKTDDGEAEPVRAWLDANREEPEVKELLELLRKMVPREFGA